MLSLLLLAVGVSVRQKAVIDRPGKYCLSGTSQCAILAVGEGDTLYIRFARSKPPKSARNVTALVWLNAHEILYSTTAIYGQPGIYAYNLRTAQERTVVPSRVRDAASPQGADFFKLIAISGNELTFWYCADADKVDESALERTASRERVVLKTKSAR